MTHGTRRRARASACAGFVVALLALAHLSATDRWPQFHGLQAGVADDDPALPDTWSETQNVKWKTTIPGQSWSSPVVWGDHVFVTSATADRPPVDLADPAAPTIVAAFKTSAPARDVAVADAFVYVGLVTGEVVILRH